MKAGVVGIPDFPLGLVKVPDERLDKLKEIFQPPKTTYPQIEFVGVDHLKETDIIISGETSKFDLIISDLETIESKLPKAKEDEKELLLRCQKSLESEVLIKNADFSDEEKKLLSGYLFLTYKPLHFVSTENPFSIPYLICVAHQMLGLVSFFTVNENELKGWSINKETPALDAAGCIHSDIKRGFIRAEVISYEEFIRCGTLHEAKIKGLIRLEGKDYIVQDGDIIKFRFSV
jgi:ribosome-binding ATPase YchF (GTP1/OBG family)